MKVFFEKGKKPLVDQRLLSIISSHSPATEKGSDMPDFSTSGRKSNASSQKTFKQEVRLTLETELLKRPNIGIELALARRLAMLGKADAEIEAERNLDLLEEYGLYKPFVISMADRIRGLTISRRGNNEAKSVSDIFKL